ncbi:protein kinase domain-containing protein, partial [Pyxidicoccus sp. 3LG]
MRYGKIGLSMAAYKQPSACATCGQPVTFPGASCAECTAITQSAGEAGWRARGTELQSSRLAEAQASAVRRSAGPPLQPGDVLEGKWRLEELLGAGGMGQVYRARDLALDRSVAIKLLHDALCEDPESVARFEREARAMARLEHAHIAPIHAVGQEGGRPFIVMKHLEGMSLARYLRSLPGPLPLSEVLALARQLCAGLAFIHQRGCVHRDIKPGNIFLSPAGHATLLDFGILWERRGSEATGSGVRLGTPSYMAPEQARGEPVDSRADLYSLGLVLLEVSTGLPPASTCRLLGQGPRGAVQALR